MSLRWLDHWIMFAVLLAGPVASAQEPAPPPPSAEPGSQLAVYLMTMGTGEAVYEWFGHNIIWIEDRERDLSIAFNYGIFDFDESGFIIRFLRGRMVYSMQGWDAPQTIQAYAADDRSIWVQELNLTPARKRALWDFLVWNAQPENRRYLYDYYVDNCSTRVRDALDGVLDGEMRRQLEPVPTGRSYRWHTRRLSRHHLPLYTGLYFVLGQPVDRPLTAWEECFLPTRMMEQVQCVMVADGAGNRVPLAGPPVELHRSSRFVEPEAPPNWVAGYMAAGVILAGLLVWLWRLAPRGRKVRWGLAVGAGLWLFLLGGAGTFLAGAWLLTDHVAVYRNENLFHLNPAALGLAVMVPAVVLGGRRLAAAAWWLALAVAVSGLLGLFLQVLPAFSQTNGELIGLTLPVHLALAWLMYHEVGLGRERKRRPAGTSEG